MADQEYVDKLLSKMSIKDANGMDASAELSELVGILKERDEKAGRTCISDSKIIDAESLGATEEKCKALIPHTRTATLQLLEMISGEIAEGDLRALRERCQEAAELFDILQDNLYTLYGVVSGCVPDLNDIMSIDPMSVTDKGGAIQCMRQYAECGLKSLEYLQESLDNGKHDECAVLEEYLFDASLGIREFYNIYSDYTKEEKCQR